eukprot:s3526_g6.t1
MVDAAAGKNFGKMTAAYLGKLEDEKGVLLAVCTSHYAEITDSAYSSFEELKLAHENRLDILPLRVCDDPWPPKPPSGPEHQHDKMGEGAGLLRLAIGKATVFVDCRGKDEIYIAARIAETLLPGGPRRPGKGVSPGPSSAAGYSQQDTKGASPDISPSSAGYSGHQGFNPGPSPSTEGYSQQDAEAVVPSASPSPADTAEAKANSKEKEGKRGSGSTRGRNAFGIVRLKTLSAA